MSTTTNNATAEQRQEIERLKQTEVNREQRGRDFYCLELLSKQESLDMDLRDMTVLAHYFVGYVDFFVLDFNIRTKVGRGFVCPGNTHDADYGIFYMPFVEKMRLPSGEVVERNQLWEPMTIRELKENSMYSIFLDNA